MDDIIQNVSDFKNTSLKEDREKYMKYREIAKNIQQRAIKEVLDAKQNLYLEWTNEGNLHDFCQKIPVYTENEFPYDKTLNYRFVFFLVKCNNLESVIDATNKREQIDGRHIPANIINKYNENRAKHL